MELQMARQTDWNALARGILLVALSGFILKLVAAGHIGQYIHPKFTWFTASACAGLLAMAAGQLRRGLRGVTGAVAPLRYRLYTIFTMVLCVGFIIPPITFGADLAHKQGMNVTNRSGKAPKVAAAALASVEQPQNAGQSAAAPQEQPPASQPAPSETPAVTPEPLPQPAPAPPSPAPAVPPAEAPHDPAALLPKPRPGQVQLQNNTAVITNQNFVPWMNELYSKPQQYADKRVTMEGFIFIPPDAGADDFAVTRLVVTCHVAHAFPDGLLAIYPGHPRPAEDNWFRAEGVLELMKYQGHDTLRIRIDRLTPVNKPPDPYIYP